MKISTSSDTLPLQAPASPRELAERTRKLEDMVAMLDQAPYKVDCLEGRRNSRAARRLTPAFQKALAEANLFWKAQLELFRRKQQSSAAGQPSPSLPFA